MALHSALGQTASTESPSRTTISRAMAYECEKRRPIRSGEVEVDEPYFGARRVRGKRGRGAGGKAIVFGVFKRDGKVYTEIVPDASREELRGCNPGESEARGGRPQRRLAEIRETYRWRKSLIKELAGIERG